jgi:hypothetical protein
MIVNYDRKTFIAQATRANYTPALLYSIGHAKKNSPSTNALAYFCANKSDEEGKKFFLKDLHQNSNH